MRSISRILLLVLCFAWFTAAGAVEFDPARVGRAAELGDVSQFKTWLAQGMSPDQRDATGWTPLMTAAWEGHVALATLLVESGADINTQNTHNETALMFAVWKNRPEIVELLLNRGARLDEFGGKGWTPLMYAAFTGQRQLTERLLSAGAKIDAVMANGSTATMMAVREGHAEIVGLLINKGARLDIRNEYGEDALAWSKKYQRDSIVQILEPAFAQQQEKTAKLKGEKAKQLEYGQELVVTPTQAFVATRKPIKPAKPVKPVKAAKAKPKAQAPANSKKKR